MSSTKAGFAPAPAATQDGVVVAPASGGAALGATLRMIKIGHTIFALPFAVIGWGFGVAAVMELERIAPNYAGIAERALPAFARALGFGNVPWAWTLIGVVLAMVGARSFAMAFNRIVDRKIDARNPRTAARELPRGLLTSRFAWGFAFASALLFLSACLMLNERTLTLAPVALAVVALYSYTKRFTALCHLVLGLGLALAPVGGWLAATGGVAQTAVGYPFTPFGLEIFGALPEGAAPASWNAMPGAVAFAPLPTLLGLGVLFWVAGFDVIYSLQDQTFDRKEGLKSLPVLLGAKRALILARVFHLIAWLCWFTVVREYASASSWLHDLVTGDKHVSMRGLGFVSYLALGLVALCLLYEHSLVKHDDLSRVDAAFFTVNGVVSAVFATAVTVDLFVV